MINSIFTVYDEKAHAHLPPFFNHNSDLAKRAFTDAVNDPQHRFSKHPQDYTLFLHGSWEDTDAAFTIQAAPKSLGNGVEFIQIPNNEQLHEAEIRNVSPVRHDSTG